VRVEHAYTPEKQGRAVARVVLGTLHAYDDIYSFWSDQYEHKIEYVGYAKKWDRIALRGSYDSRKFLAFYLDDGILRAVLGLNRGGDPEAEPESELRACQALIRARAPLAEAALADERVDLRSLDTTPR
jgi:3-phenylpropionate/trans-cinnamate dioxygenase ferredoxin reductase subunit